MMKVVGNVSLIPCPVSLIPYPVSHSLGGFMSLTAKRSTTEKRLAANRANGRKSRGAVTPEGKARAAQANLRHGFYSQQNGALAALGEDPKDYEGLMKSLENNLGEGLEAALKQRIGDTLWRMKRAVRMQNSIAVKRVQAGLQLGTMLVTPPWLRMNGILKGLCAISRMHNREDSTPAPGEIQALMNAFGPTPPDNVQQIFPLLQSYGQAALMAPGPGNIHGYTGPHPAPAGWQERQAADQRLSDAVDGIIMPYAFQEDALRKEVDKVESPENIAALMAPRDGESLLLQRMEDSNLRQLWRLTNILSKVQKGALT